MSVYGSNNCVRVKVLFFAKARELAGVDDAQFVCQRQIPVGVLIEELNNKFQLQDINFNFILAVNEVYREDLEEILELRPDDEIAIIPPVSGG